MKLRETKLVAQTTPTEVIKDSGLFLKRVPVNILQPLIEAVGKGEGQDNMNEIEAILQATLCDKDGNEFEEIAAGGNFIDQFTLAELTEVTEKVIALCSGGGAGKKQGKAGGA